MANGRTQRERNWILSAMRLTGQMLSMGIATLIVAVYIGNVQITPEYYPAFMESLKAAFMVFAAFCYLFS